MICKIYLVTLRFFLLPYLLVTGNMIHAQVNIHGCIAGLPSPKVYLAEVYAGKAKLIDSVMVNNNCFDFSESDTLHEGIYYVILNREMTAFVQLIFNKENVAFHSVYNSLPDSLVIDKSADNKIMYDYIEQSKLNPQNEKLVDNIIDRNPHSLLSGILRAQKPIKYPADFPEKEKENYLYVHYFDHIDLNNVALIRSDILSNAMLNFLNHYENKSLTIPEQAERYAVAVDSLLIKTKAYPAIHNFFINELSDKFRYGDYDVVCAYINEYYITQDLCTNGNISTDVRTRIAALKHASVGKQAPEIVMPSYDGKSVKMSEIKSDYLLIVFWSSFCFHCTQVLPKLKQVYDHRNGSSLEILAISTDTYQQEWQNFIKNENLTWINYCDLKGWDSDITKSYNVQGTPTYILLNKEKTIIAKPATLEALVIKLRDLSLF